ncbi:hypothetical protein GE09DRAFT_497717 [Coniochaeta sp. 2T2.1]|nr:hypothetical protein GE09DRAFT_497717 [Coniochaeta sp. 2T2.1]
MSSPFSKMDTDDDPSSAAELAFAKVDRILQKQARELKHVKADLGSRMGDPSTEVGSLKTDVHGLVSLLLEMQRRRNLNEERDAYRQQMLFNGIKRIAEDVHELKQRVRALEAGTDGGGGGDGSKDDNNSNGAVHTTTPRKSSGGGGGGSCEVRTPGSVNAAKRAAENRKNFERTLEHHITHMNIAMTIDEVQASGSLAVKYSDELLKNFL